jgi:hypothetical protein
MSLSDPDIAAEITLVPKGRPVVIFELPFRIEKMACVHFRGKRL